MGYRSQLGLAWDILGYFRLRRLHFSNTHDAVTPYLLPCQNIYLLTPEKFVELGMVAPCLE